MSHPTAILLFNDKERKTAEDLVHRMVKRAVEMEGTVTGEHGVGLVKRDYLRHELGESTVDAMRKVSHGPLFYFQIASNAVYHDNRSN
jgi:D-lactate dehydrogenase (cytochrome)